MVLTISGSFIRSSTTPRTFIGVNAINRCFWVCAMMEDVSKYGVLAVQTLRNNIMASTLFASMAIMLSSLIALLMSNATSTQSAGKFALGDRSQLRFSVKFFSILVCFLAAFVFNVQSVRYFSHASILINVPFKKMNHNHSRRSCHLTPEYVGRMVNRGKLFLVVGSASIPLLFSSVSLDLRSDSHVSQLPCSSFHNNTPVKVSVNQ